MLVLNGCSGTMERRVGLLFLFLLGACWACDARQLGEPELSGKSMDSDISSKFLVVPDTLIFSVSRSICAWVTYCSFFFFFFWVENKFGGWMFPI